MSENDSNENRLTPIGPVEEGAKFANPGNVTVQVNTENLNINVSSLTAIARIAAVNPDVAQAIIPASRAANEAETKKYVIGAIGAALVALAMIIGCA